MADRPSPSDIFKSPEWMWKDGAVYDVQRFSLPADKYSPEGGTGWMMRIQKDYLTIPFTLDPYGYTYPIPNSKSEDPLFDQEHHLLYLDGATAGDHALMVEWLANEWLHPPAGCKPRANLIYYDIPGRARAIHRLVKIDVVKGVRYWTFRGDNNFLGFILLNDAYKAKDENIRWLCATIVY